MELTFALPLAQLTEMAFGPAIERWIWDGSLPVVLSAAIPVVRGRKSVAGLRDVCHGCVYGVCKTMVGLSKSLSMPDDVEEACYHSIALHCPMQRDVCTRRAGLCDRLVMH